MWYPERKNKWGEKSAEIWIKSTFQLIAILISYFWQIHHGYKMLAGGEAR